MTEADLVVSHEDFLRIIRPALGTMSPTDAMAILKHSAFMIFGKKHITYRLPSETPIQAHRIHYTKASIILNSSRPILRNYKEGGPIPLDYEDHTAWETVSWFNVALVNRLLEIFCCLLLLSLLPLKLSS